ncbi:MAG: rhombosortase [Gammaproteobacteria bacterium]|nr:rhombosortase [Gammaproteobacteria bacterium]
MGLSNDLKSVMVRRFAMAGTWRIAAVLGGFSLLAALAGDAGRQWLRWDRGAIADGEIWRLVSGHLVHMNWSHFGLNAAGLILVWLLVGERFSSRNWVWIVVVTIAGTDLGFWFLDPQLQWYVGMSGLLHGLLMAGLVMGVLSEPRESLLIGAFVVAKLAFEQLSGSLPGSEMASGGPVIVNAHLYGSISATVVAIIYLIRVRAARTI